MNTLRKDSTMTPAAKSVLDATTEQLTKARAENARLTRENERLQGAINMFLSSPAQAMREKAQKAIRYYNPALTKTRGGPDAKPVPAPGGGVDEIATTIQRMHASARR